ncbi:hypothetical protein PZB74_03790 [Porifericola rhodea]|nr:hypothetical protein [Porifericola rhodea]WKN32468.1 hypothetical protein PZB74_03790 [Porifericola rhodea]
MKVLRLLALACFLLASVSSCDFLNYDEVDKEQRLGGGGDDPPCNRDCK